MLTPMEEEAEAQWRNIAINEARAIKNKPILEIFNDFCAIENFGFPIFKPQKSLKSTPKKSLRMSLTINTLGISGKTYI